MPSAAIKLQGLCENHAISVRPSGTEILVAPELEARSQLHILQHSTPGLHTASQSELVLRSIETEFTGDRETSGNASFRNRPDMTDS